MLKDMGSVRRTSKETKDGIAAHLCHGLAMGCTPGHLGAWRLVQGGGLFWEIVKTFCLWSLADR